MAAVALLSFAPLWIWTGLLTSTAVPPRRPLARVLCAWSQMPFQPACAAMACAPGISGPKSLCPCSRRTLTSKSKALFRASLLPPRLTMAMGAFPFPLAYARHSRRFMDPFPCSFLSQLCGFLFFRLQHVPPLWALLLALVECLAPVSNGRRLPPGRHRNVRQEHLCR